MEPHRKILLFLLLSAGLWACRPQQGEKEPAPAAKDSLSNQSGTYIKEYHDKSGNLYSRVTMKDGVPTGPSITYYTDGTKNTEVDLVAGKKNGLEKKFYGSGEVYRERMYDMGVQDGWERRYYKNGQLMSEVYFHQGLLSNQIREYDHEGDLEKNYPHIVFRLVHDREYAGQKLLQIQLSNHSPSVHFYRGTLQEGKYLPARIQEFGGKGGTAEYSINGIPAGTPIHVIAKYITIRHTPCLITGTYIVK